MIDFFKWWLAIGSHQIGRMRYVLTNISVVVVLYIISFVMVLMNATQQHVDFFSVVAWLVLTSVAVSTSAQRLRDVNRSDKLSLIALVPIIAMLFMIWLAIQPSSSQQTSSGPQ